MGGTLQTDSNLLEKNTIMLHMDQDDWGQLCLLIIKIASIPPTHLLRLCCKGVFSWWYVSKILRRDFSGL